LRAATWSIAGRITRTFVVTTVSTALAMAAVNAWFLHRSLEREISALIAEELEELELLVRDAEPSRDELEGFVEVLQAEHPANPLAFRVWIDGVDEPLGDFGAGRLLGPDVPTRRLTADTQLAEGGLRWRTERVGSRLVVGAVVDGSANLALFRQFAWTSFAVAGLAAMLALGAGAVVIRRTRRMLLGVAERARSARWSTSESELHVEDAPEEIRRITDGLAEMRRNIRQEAERARLLASGMAHELGSPIQNLVVQGEVALMRERTNDEFRRLIASQLEELRDLSHAVGNLVALCTVTAAGSEDSEEFDLAHELELRLTRERRHASQRDVRFEVRCDGDPTVRGDREALLLALGNLISNAIDWSPPGSGVALSIEQHGDEIEVLVDDAGPGIAPELREKVFEPFFRGPAARGRRHGYGIGLSIARAAVRAQSGSIRVEDSPAGGTRMRLRLPRG
jgi:two-component system heavy metal sensor histidine kinase CusS